MFVNNSSVFSWYRVRQNLFRLQKRIYKSILVGDFIYALKLQKALVISNSARLLAIRFVTQFSFDNDYVTFSNKNATLSFSDKFKLNNFLLDNFNKWNPHKLKFISVYDTLTCSFREVMLWSISDRCWHCLVKFAVEPAHEVSFYPRSFGFRNQSLFHDAQRIIFLNLSHKAHGIQKRIVLISLPNIFIKFDFNVFLKRLFCPRFIKLGLFRFFKLGFSLFFQSSTSSVYFLESLLANIYLQDIDFLFNGLRYGSNLLIFLRPMENETFILNKLSHSLTILGVKKGRKEGFKIFLVVFNLFFL